MKKIYLVPSTEIVNVTIQQMIATSPFTVNASGDVTEGELLNDNATGAAMSRGGFWDDED